MITAPFSLPHFPVSSSLHVKFDVTSGPSVPAPVIAQFMCNGVTLSGLGFQLTTDAFKVSLIIC